MKCPRCGNPKMCRAGRSIGRFNTKKLYKCWKCSKQTSELISGTPGKEYMKSRDYALTMSLAQLQRWKEATPEELTRWSDCHKGSHLNKPGKKLRLRKKNFLGMLGDIEVYALDFGGVDRQPQDLPAQWARTTDGKPELKVRKPG